MKMKKLFLVSLAAAALIAGMFSTQSCNNSGLSPEEVAALQTKYDSIMQAYDNIKADYAELENTNTQAANEIRQKDSIINVQAKQIRNSLNGGGTGSRSKLQRQINDMQAQCDDLRSQVEALTEENKRLREENQKAQEDLASANEKIDKLNAENADANQKLAVAGTLLINDLKATPEKKKCGKSNKFKATDKSSAVERVNISGKILPNNVAEPGTKTFYARITKGSNLVTNLGDEPKSFKMDGVDMQYTCEQDLEFYGQSRAFSMIWKKSDATKLDAGVYTVTIYNSGKEIGKANFTLK